MTQTKTGKSNLFLFVTAGKVIIDIKTPTVFLLVTEAARIKSFEIKKKIKKNYILQHRSLAEHSEHLTKTSCLF